MPRQTQSVKTHLQPFSGEKAKAYFANARQIWQFQHKSDFVIKEHAESIGINETSYGEIIRGKRRAQIQQCLFVARDLDLSVDEVLRIEGYPDLTALIALVEEDETPRYPGEKDSILATLRIAHKSPVWQQADPKTVIYKQKADFALASDLDPYTKAAYYADEVHEFSEHLRNNQLQHRAQRKTGEIPISVS